MGGAWRAQVSMMDEDVWQKICGVLSTADGVRREGATRSAAAEPRDSIGDIHLLLFGDFKQLPPATGKAPFIVVPLVQTFQFRVLRQNRPLFCCILPTTVPYPNIEPKIGVWCKTKRGPRRSRISITS